MDKIKTAFGNCHATLQETFLAVGRIESLWMLHDLRFHDDHFPAASRILNHAVTHIENIAMSEEVKMSVIWI